MMQRLFLNLNHPDWRTSALRRQSGLGSRFVQDLVWVRSLYDYQQQQAGQQIGCHNKICAVERIARCRGNITREGRCNSRAEIAEAADERDAAGGARLGQILGDGGEEQWRRRNEPEAGERQAYDRCYQIAVGKCDGQQADCRDGHAGGVVPSPLSGLVRVTPHQNRADNACDLRQGGKQTYVQQIGHTPAFDQRGNPEHHGVGRAQQQKVGEREAVDFRILQHLEESGVVRGLDILVIMIELEAQRRFFLGAQPLGVFRFILKIEVGGKTEDRRRQALGNEEPLPAMPAFDVVEILHRCAGNRTGDHRRDGRRGHEHRNDLAAPRRRVPVRQIENDAREEARFERAKQEPGHVELQRRLHERHCACDKSPREHDAQQGLANTDALKQQVAGYFEQEVADEEYARAETVCRIAESQRLLHLKLGISDVDAIEKRDHVTKNQEGQNPPTDLGEQPCDGVWLLFSRRNCTDAGCVDSHCLLPSFVFPRSLLLRVGTYLLSYSLTPGAPRYLRRLTLRTKRI